MHGKNVCEWINKLLGFLLKRAINVSSRLEIVIKATLQLLSSRLSNSQ